MGSLCEKVERTITINASIEKVYEYLMQPANLLEIWPSMVEVEDVKNAGNVGGGFHWGCKLVEAFFVKQNEQEMDMLFANLNARMEA